MDITRLNPPRSDLSKGFLKTADLNLGELRVCDLRLPPQSAVNTPTLFPGLSEARDTIQKLFGLLALSTPIRPSPVSILYGHGQSFRFPERERTAKAASWVREDGRMRFS